MANTSRGRCAPPAKSMHAKHTIKMTGLAVANYQSREYQQCVANMEHGACANVCAGPARPPRSRWRS